MVNGVMLKLAFLSLNPIRNARNSPTMHSKTSPPKVRRSLPSMRIGRRKSSRFANPSSPPIVCGVGGYFVIATGDQPNKELIGRAVHGMSILAPAGVAVPLNFASPNPTRVGELDSGDKLSFTSFIAAGRLLLHRGWDYHPRRRRGQVVPRPASA